MQILPENHRTLQIGIHRKQGYFDFVWFDELERPQCYQIFVNDKDFKIVFTTLKNTISRENLSFAVCGKYFRSFDLVESINVTANIKCTRMSSTM